MVFNAEEVRKSRLSFVVDVLMVKSSLVKSSLVDRRCLYVYELSQLKIENHILGLETLACPRSFGLI